MAGIFIDIRTFKLDLSKALPSAYEEYSHVKIENKKRIPEEMPYYATPHHRLDLQKEFYHFVETIEGKEWGLSEVDDGKGNYFCQMYYKNNQTENVYVGYSKTFTTSHERNQYSVKAIQAKIDKKGYERKGKKTMRLNDFNPYI